MLRPTLMLRPQNASAATPAGSGFTMPAEWAPHAATWLAWPHNPKDWPSKFDAIPWVYCELVRTVSAGEKIACSSGSNRDAARAKSIFQHAGVDLRQVRFVTHPTNRGWTRDTGPIFVQRKTTNSAHCTSQSKTAIVHFHFNGWGNKYANWRRDAKVPETAARVLRMKLFHAGHAGKPFTIEGGGIEVNGRGTLLTTEQCYLDPKIQVRNPGLGKKEIETALKNNLGAKHFLARQWAGGRRHPRPHRRHLPVRECEDARARPRKKPPRRQFPSARGKLGPHPRFAP